MWSLHRQLAPRASIPATAICRDLNARADGLREGNGLGPTGKPWPVRLSHWLGQWKILMKPDLTDWDVAFIFSVAPAGLVQKTAAFLGPSTSVDQAEHLIVVLTAASARVCGVAISHRAIAR